MTRQEAVKTMAGGWFGPSEVAEKWIDMFVKLGMLKLEEPKSQRERLVEILGNRDWMASDVDEFRECLCEAGLQIVEK
jgi:hypothetical protein